MAGERLKTTPSEDCQFDEFATKSDDCVKVIAGTRTVQSLYNIEISGLSSLGLSAESSIDVHVYQFVRAGKQGQMGEPIGLGLTASEYASDTARPHPRPG